LEKNGKNLDDNGSTQQNKKKEKKSRAEKWYFQKKCLSFFQK